MRVRIRTLRALAELQMVEEVARRSWNFSDRELPPIADLIAMGHVGGLVAGAFEGREMLGLVTGMPRLGLGEPCLHSHMLAVVPEAQGRGLSVRLKLFQRRFCLDHGIGLVTWTYDPLLVKNAGLNLNRLRARPGIYAGEPQRALHARLELRRLAETLFARGFAATGIVPGPRTALYLFER